MSLREAADELGVHYMTAYRYVRLGQLPATKDGNEWRVRSSDVAALRDRPKAGRPSSSADWPGRLYDRLINGDETGAWKVIEASLASGREPVEALIDVIGPAMRRVGTGWADGKLDIAVEHRASAITQRLVSRLGAMMRPRGRRRGDVVIGSPAGERHSLPLAMVGDVLRDAGYNVMDLGADVPDDSFALAVSGADRLKAIGIGVSSAKALPAARRLIKRLRSEVPGGTTILVGGSAVESAESVGADFLATDAREAVEFLAS